MLPHGNSVSPIMMSVIMSSERNLIIFNRYGKSYPLTLKMKTILQTPILYHLFFRVYKSCSIFSCGVVAIFPKGVAPFFI